jgi:hypothetical protein
MPWRRGIVVIASTYRTEDPEFESRQGERFLGISTLQSCCNNLPIMHCQCVYLRKKECLKIKIKKNFGKNFWENSVSILTCARRYQVLRENVDVEKALHKLVRQKLFYFVDMSPIL